MKVSSKGQIVIPKEVRRRLGITPGKKLLVAVGDEEIVLRKTEDISLREVSKRTSAVASGKKIDVDTLVDEAIRWARSSG